MSIDLTVENEMNIVFSTILDNEQNIIDSVRKELINCHFQCCDKLSVTCNLDSNTTPEVRELSKVAQLPLCDILVNNTECSQYLKIDTLKVDSIYFVDTHLKIINPYRATLRFNIEFKNKLDDITIAKNLYEKFKQNKN